MRSRTDRCDRDLTEANKQALFKRGLHFLGKQSNLVEHMF